MRSLVSPSHTLCGLYQHRISIASLWRAGRAQPMMHVACARAPRPLSEQAPSALLTIFPLTTSINFAMIFLLLVYFLTQSNLGGDASPIPQMERRAEPSCDDLEHCRTIWSIIWSCLSTVLLCTWVALHPNIAIAPDTHDKNSEFEAKLWRLRRSFVKLWHLLRGFLKNKLPLFLCALIAPEYILAWAIRQHLSAREIQRKWNNPQESTDKYPAPGRKWTRAHGFFLIMGGFHLYSLPDGATSVPYPPELSTRSKFVVPLPGHLREDETAKHPLAFHHLSVDELTYLAPTEREIKDKGKANIIAKILVVLQTSWFIAQCIARLVEHLPLTELEVVTLAYATMNAFIYFFWLDKPKDVECPVRVYKASNADRVVESGKKEEWESGMEGLIHRVGDFVTGSQDDHYRLSEEDQVPILWSGKSGDSVAARSMIGASILGMTFGAIHFIAWNSEFPSHIELLLWRISCVTITAFPLTVTIICGVWEMGPEVDSILTKTVIELVMASLPLTLLLYSFARIATLVMAFTTLRALPSDAFKTVDWATFILHL